MSRADVIKQIADLHYKLADAYLELAGDSASAPVSAARPVAADSLPAAPASFSDGVPVEEPPVWTDDIPADLDAIPEQGSEAVCPKHRRPYKEGKFGPFCTSTSDDPAWSNKRGYCSITPKNAATYLRVKAAA